MPKYSAKLVVPADRTSRDPVKVDLDVSQGRIAQVSVTWSMGSWWLNALVIKYEGAQIIPSEGGGQCRGDGFPDTWPEHIILDKPHPTLNIEAWNEGNDYEHEALVDIIVLPHVPEPLRPVRELVEIFKRVVGLG